MKSDQTAQHITMATSTYRDWFNKSMKELYPNMLDSDISALAWGGLESTKEWIDYKNANPYQATQIMLTNDEYYDGSKGVKCLDN